MNLRVVFMGTPEFAVPSLDALLQGPIDLLGVVTQPDRPAGRGKQARPSPVKRRALQDRIPVMDSASVKHTDFIHMIHDLDPQVIVVVAFGQILPTEILQQPTLGCLNVHASLLPKYRGAAPIPWAILNGETTTGVSVIRMNERLDAGDILLSQHLHIGENETAHELSHRLSRLGARVLMATLGALKLGNVRCIPQREEGATYAPRLRKSDGRIRWKAPAEEISRLVRAMTPWPGAFTYWRGRRVKVHRARARPMDPYGASGEVVRADKGCLWVQTGDGILEIEEMQPEGRAKMSASAFVQGHGDILGAILEY